MSATLAGKSGAQFAVMASAAVVVALTLYAFVLCIRTRNVKRKWLWILFILVGFGAVQANWTTGEIGFKLLNIQLFSAGAVAQSYSPWIITAALPLGAIIFLFKRWQRGREWETPATNEG